MTEAAILSAILWFGLLSLRAAEAVRWWLAAFDFALIALAAGIFVRRRLAIRVHPVAAVLAIAGLWSLAQVWLGISVDPRRTLESALGWAMNCAAFSVALAATARPEARRRFLDAQVLFALLLSIVWVFWLYIAAVLGPFVYKNQFAVYMESVMGIAIANALRDRRQSLPWILVAGTMFACVAACGSRAGTILCLSELIVLPVAARLRGWIDGKSLARVAGLAIASATVLVMVTGWETVWTRLQEPNPYAIREDLLLSSVAMAKDRPLQGFGMGAWPSAYPGYARYDDGSYVNEAHNDWAQWAVEGGLPFLLLMIAMVAMLVRPAMRSIWGLGVIAVFVHAWVDYPFEQRPALAAFLFAMAGVLAGETQAAKARSADATASAAPYRPDEPSRP